MAGYSGTPLVTKIGIKPGHTLFLDGAPDLDLGDLAGVTSYAASRAKADVTLTFHTELAALEKRLPELFERTTTAGMVWVCWPKQAAQKAQGIASDLDDEPRPRAGPRSRLRRREGRRGRRHLVGPEVRPPSRRPMKNVCETCRIW